MGERGSMVFKVESDGRVISCSSPECIKRLLLQGWKLADPAQWDDLKDALLSESGLTPSSKSGRSTHGCSNTGFLWTAPMAGCSPMAGRSCVRRCSEVSRS